MVEGAHELPGGGVGKRCERLETAILGGGRIGDLKDGGGRVEGKIHLCVCVFVAVGWLVGEMNLKEEENEEIRI